MSHKSPELVDVEQIVRSKTGDKFKYVPRFVVNYLKKIIHEEEVNECILQHPDAVGLDFIHNALEYLDIHLEVHGLENLPEEGLCTFVSNHPLGGPDGLAIGKVVGEHYEGKMCFLLNSFLMNLKPLAPLGIAVNKMGGQARNLPRLVDEAFASDKHIIMFPAGLCSRRRGGVIRDLDWAKTFVVKSIRYQRDVVPVCFSGHNSNFFYRLANISKALGIKFNFAMLYLSDEMFKHRGDTFKVFIGKPIPWQTFDKSKTPAEWAAYVKDIVYKLGE